MNIADRSKRALDYVSLFCDEHQFSEICKKHVIKVSKEFIKNEKFEELKSQLKKWDCVPPALPRFLNEPADAWHNRIYKEAGYSDLIITQKGYYKK